MNNRMRYSIVIIFAVGPEVMQVIKKKKSFRPHAWEIGFPNGYREGFEKPQETLSRVAYGDFGVRVESGVFIAPALESRTENLNKENEFEEFTLTECFLVVLRSKAQVVLNVDSKWKSVKWVHRREAYMELPGSTRRWLPWQLGDYLITGKIGRP